MSFISAGIAGAGLAAQIGGSLLKQEPKKVFDYAAADRELGRVRQQIADREEYGRMEAEDRARQRALAEAERVRQGALTGESNTSVQHEIGHYDNVPGQVDARAKQLGDYFAANAGGMPTGIMPAARTAHTADYATGALAKAGDFNTAQNTALGKLRSFGDVWGDLGRDSLQDKSHMTNVADFKQGSKALLPAEMRPIVNRQVPQITAGNFGNLYDEEQPDNTFSDILKGAGKIGVSAGLSGFNPFGGGSFSGTPEGLFSYGSPGYAANLRYGGPK